MVTLILRKQILNIFVFIYLMSYISLLIKIVLEMQMFCVIDLSLKSKRVKLK